MPRDALASAGAGDGGALVGALLAATSGASLLLAPLAASSIDGTVAVADGGASRSAGALTFGDGGTAIGRVAGDGDGDAVTAGNASPIEATARAGGPGDGSAGLTGDDDLVAEGNSFSTVRTGGRGAGAAGLAGGAGGTVTAGGRGGHRDGRPIVDPTCTGRRRRWRHRFHRVLGRLGSRSSSRTRHDEADRRPRNVSHAFAVALIFERDFEPAVLNRYDCDVCTRSERGKRHARIRLDADSGLLDDQTGSRDHLGRSHRRHRGQGKNKGEHESGVHSDASEILLVDAMTDTNHRAPPGTRPRGHRASPPRYPDSGFGWQCLPGALRAPGTARPAPLPSGQRDGLAVQAAESVIGVRR